MSELRRSYDLLVETLRVQKIQLGQKKTALKNAKREYDEKVKVVDRLERQVAKRRAEIDQALAFATTVEGATDALPAEPAPVVAEVKPEPKQPAPKEPRPIPRSLRQLVEAFPADQSTGLRDLRHLLDLSDGGLNARIQNAKKAGLVERVGWGQYKLTDKGRAAKAAQTRKLHLVSSEGA